MIDQAEYSALFARIRSAHPHVDLSDATVNTDGLVNIAIIAGGQVYRFARESFGVALLKQEMAVLRLVNQYVTMPVPEYQLLAEDFVTYRFMKGEALMRNDILQLPEQRQDQLAEQLAVFLRQLHVIASNALDDAGVGASGGRQTQMEWLALYEDVQRELFPLMYRVTRTWVDQHFAPLLKDEHWLDFEPTLIHDDLAQYHILYDAAAQQINGVIDFGTAGKGDPARDYGMLINVYGESFVARMTKYDPQIAALLNRARFYAGTFELQWVLGGVRSKMFDWFTAHLDRARDVQPYAMKE